MSIPDLASDKDSYNSAIRSLQLSYSTVPNVSSLYRDMKTICRVFRLLGRWPALTKDRKFSIWEFLKGNVPRRVGLMEKMEGAYQKSVLPSEGLPLFLDMSTPLLVVLLVLAVPPAMVSILDGFRSVLLAVLMMALLVVIRNMQQRLARAPRTNVLFKTILFF